MTKWVMALLLLYLVGIICNGLIEMDYVQDAPSKIDQIVQGYKEIEFSWNLFETLGSIVRVGWNYMSILFKVLTWEYAFFEGGWVIIRALFCCVSGAFVFAAIWSAVRGTQVT